MWETYDSLPPASGVWSGTRPPGHRGAPESAMWVAALGFVTSYSLGERMPDGPYRWAPLGSHDREALISLSRQRAGAAAPGRSRAAGHGAFIDFQGGTWPDGPVPPALRSVYATPGRCGSVGMVWRLQAGAHEATAAVRLWDPVDGVQGLLVRSGSWFGYARDRTARLRSGVSLTEQIRGSASTAAAVALLDCEVSIGRIDQGNWLITASTLPHRHTGRPRPDLCGSMLDLLRVHETDPDGRAFIRTWQINEAAGLLHTLSAIEPDHGRHLPG